MKIQNFLIISLAFLFSCQNQVEKDFDPNRLLSVIKENGNKWVAGIAEQDLDLIMQNYDSDAQYLPDSDDAIRGRQQIREHWRTNMSMLTDLRLNIHSLGGQKELLYETGSGSVKIISNGLVSDTLQFKYTNLWKLQKDGSYKVVLDMFNNAK